MPHIKNEIKLFILLMAIPDRSFIFLFSSMLLLRPRLRSLRRYFSSSLDPVELEKTKTFEKVTKQVSDIGKSIFLSM